ncbi:M4 family metallopeptidase [Radiobacillus kanasensis]|uniref:M4 family metallopeptidase n=1 Tax=Radiobacillus kanasensis TaxID=2844358 RepID=UPI001E4078A1|nr:M4 family metallopeptidase [Radiobacillus kanasensis]UFT99683.1 M4 family metallopeptidase [Radiobacillus kanasensis]
MKKTLTVGMMLTLVVGSLSTPFSPEVSAAKNEQTDQKLEQMKVLEKLEKSNTKKHVKVDWDKKRGVPEFISGDISKSTIDSDEDVLSFLEENRDLFSLKTGSFSILDVTTDELGMTHYKVELKVDDIPVYGSELIVHTDKNGMITSMNGQVEPKLEKVKWKKRVKLTEKEAIHKAETVLSFDPTSKSYSTDPNTKLVLYQDKKKWLPAYLVDLQYIQPEAGRKQVFVSAVNGKIVESIDMTQEAATTGTGVGSDGETVNLQTYQSGGTYYLYDTSKPMDGIIRTYTANQGTSLPGSYVTDSDNNFRSSSQAAAVDAHYFAGLTYDYYHETHGRNSYDNNGSDLVSTVHYGSNYNNAFWNGSQMVYGDGDGSTFSPLSGSLDVVAHELTHAVTDTTANLVYQNQSGALNESMSDVFAVIIEAESGDFDWQLGEDVYTPGTPGDALRSLENPELYDQPSHMDDYYNTSADNGGVHTNSGIPNKAFYYIASDIGLDKSGDIYYRALTNYLTSQADFEDARNALLQSAVDLYGANSTEYQAVTDGYAAVGIGSNSGTNNDTYEPNDTTSEAHQIENGTNYDSYIYSGSDVDYYTFTSSEAGTIQASLTNLPGDYDFYLYNSSGTLLAQSENSSNNSESISYSASATGTYFLKVVGYNGASSSSTAYQLSATYPTGSQETAQWYYESASAETAHPYANNYTGGHTYTKSGAQKVALHFSKFETEAGYDYVEIKDKNENVTATYDGTKSDFWVIVDGDTISTNLVTDYSVTKYGYKIDQVGYFSDQQLSTKNIISSTK